MAVPQQKIREIVLQLLYSYDMAEPKRSDMEALLMKELSVTRKTLRQAQEKVDKVLAIVDELDKAIGEVTESYAFERIQRVERSVLRLGVYELFYDETIPEKVAIAEAMRLSKKFSTKESAAFVNALLDTLRKARSGEEAPKEELSEAYALMVESEELSNEAAIVSSEEDNDATEDSKSGSS